MFIKWAVKATKDVRAGLFATLFVILACGAGQAEPSSVSAVSSGRCEAIYGAAPDFMMCEATEGSCNFNVTLGGVDSCDDICSDHGGSCLTTYHNGHGPSCDNNGAKPCSQVGPTDKVCVCSRPDDNDLGVAVSVFEHQTDFLSIDACTSSNIGTTFYPNAGSSSRGACRRALVARGYRHMYLSVASKSHNYYDDAAGFRSLLQELLADGIKPVVWLTSDTGSWRNQSMAAIKADLAAFIPKVDDLVDSYSLGIEIDEYWSAKEADMVAQALYELSQKEVAFHQRAARWDYCKSSDHCDYMILQYGFGLSKAEIREMTRRAASELGRPVVGGEYNLMGESKSRPLGTAAMEAGASGFGNGGQPF